MQALNGSVSIRNTVGNTLNVNNTLGSIIGRDQVLFETLGTVFDSSGTVLEKANIELNGGIIQANAIEFVSPSGMVKADVDALNGDVGVSAGDLSVAVQNGSLNISRMDLTGDPTFIVNGDLNFGIWPFTGTTIFTVLTPVFNTKGGVFVAYATGDIYSKGILDSTVGSQVKTEGGLVDLRAGYNWKNNSVSSSGGSIKLGHISFDTAGGTFNASASAGKNSSGSISLGNISTVPTGAGLNGANVTIAADGSITTGNINASGSAGNSSKTTGGAGGTITIYTLSLIHI